MPFDTDPLKPSIMMILAAVVLFAVAIIHLFSNGFNLGPYATTLLLVATFLITASAVASRYQKFDVSLTGIKTETHDLARSISDLEKQVKAVGHLAVFEQVCALNRLAIEKPELAQVWRPIIGIRDIEQVKRIFYIYCFLDAYQMMHLFRTDKLLADEVHALWRDNWMRQLLDSETGKLMQNGGMLDYYTKDMLKELKLTIKRK